MSVVDKTYQCVLCFTGVNVFSQMHGDVVSYTVCVIMSELAEREPAHTFKNSHHSVSKLHI